MNARTWHLGYAEIVELPAPMAQAVQVLKTAQALCEEGASATVHARLLARADVPTAAAQILGREPHGRLAVRPLRSRHKGLAGLDHRARLWRRLIAPAGAGQVFYGRSRRQTLELCRLRALLRSPARILYEFHNVEAELAREEGDLERAQRIRKEERALAREVDAVVAISEPLAEDVARFLPPGKPLSVVPDGVDLELFGRRDAPPLAGEDVLVVYAGSLYPYKGVDDLVAMLAQLPARVRLQVVGGQGAADLERLKRLAAQRGVAGRVSFTGLVSPAEIQRHLARADLVCLPAGHSLRSTRYTSPLKLFEAMAAGVPVIAAPVPALSALLRDGENAWLAREASPRAFARAVERAIADAGLSRSLARRAADQARGFSWRARARRILALLDEVEHAPGGPAQRS